MRTLGLADHSEDIAEGTIVAKNGSAAIVAYDPEGEAPVNVPVGVLVRTAPADDEAGNVIVHGCVFAETLLVGGEAVTDTDIAALEANTALFVTRS
ncbi:MAG: head decoration protein [Deferribacterales bacterium]